MADPNPLEAKALQTFYSVTAHSPSLRWHDLDEKNQRAMFRFPTSENPESLVTFWISVGWEVTPTEVKAKASFPAFTCGGWEAHNLPVFFQAVFSLVSALNRVTVN